MFNKIYEYIRKTLSNNYKSILFFILVLFFATFKLPFYISATGGLLDVSKRIVIENSSKVEGSFNMAYVSEMHATIPLYIISLFNKNWDIVKKEDIVYENESYEDSITRGKILLEESINNAILVASKKAGRSVSESDHGIVVIYISNESDTDLKIGDYIKKIDNTEINRIEDISFIKDYQIGKKIDIKVKNGKKDFERYANLIEIDNEAKIGVSLIETKKIKTDYEYKLKFKSGESGPSGGLITTLSIYNYLTDFDITKGRKIAGTGTIDLDGAVGSIGGVKYKLAGVVKDRADIFLVPAGENYEEAVAYKKKNNYKIEIVSISTFDEALEYLMSH